MPYSPDMGVQGAPPGVNWDQIFQALRDLTQGITAAVPIGEWVPTLTFDTPGDLSVIYSSQKGIYWVQEALVTIHWQIVTSTFTHTTASGTAFIAGIPFIASPEIIRFQGLCAYQGITKANYSDCYVDINEAVANDKLRLTMSGSGQARAAVTAADMPSGGSVGLFGTMQYLRAKP